LLLALFPHIAKGKGKGNRSVVNIIAASLATSPKRQFASTNQCFYAAVTDEASYVASKMAGISLACTPEEGMEQVQGAPCPHSMSQGQVEALG
jgi:hypothetical protein